MTGIKSRYQTQVLHVIFPLLPLFSKMHHTRYLPISNKTCDQCTLHQTVSLWAHFPLVLPCHAQTPKSNSIICLCSDSASAGLSLIPECFKSVDSHSFRSRNALSEYCAASRGLFCCLSTTE